MSQRWYCRIDGHVKGPMEFAGLQALVAAGELRGVDEVRTTRSQEWSKAAGIEGLFPDQAQADDLAAMLSDDRPTRRPPGRDAGWYCRIGGQVRGPMTFESIGQLAGSGLLMPQDEVRVSNDADWVRANSIVGLFDDTSSSTHATRDSAPAAGAIPSIEEFQIESPSAVAAKVPKPSAPSATSSSAYGDAGESRTWYCEMGGHEIGPLTFEAISELAQSGRLTRQDKIRNGLQTSWEIADSIVGLFSDPAAPVARPAEPVRATKPATKARTPEAEPRPTPIPASRSPQEVGRAKTPSEIADDIVQQMLASRAENPSPASRSSRRSGSTPPPPTRKSSRAPDSSSPSNDDAGASSASTSGACGVLILSLASPDADLRCQTAAALGALGNREALAPLERLLADGEIRVRRAAAEALIQLGHPKGESLRTIAQRAPIDGAAASKTIPPPPKKTRVKREFRLSLSSFGDARTFLKRGGLAFAALVVICGILLMNGTIGGWHTEKPTIPVAGDVTTSEGTPVTGVRLILVPENGDVLSTFGFDLDQQGHFAGRAISGSYKYYFAPVAVERNEDDGSPVNKNEALKLKGSMASLGKLPPVYCSADTPNGNVQIPSDSDLHLVVTK